MSWRISTRSRPSASISASTPYRADRPAGEHGVRAVVLRRQRRERRQHGGAQVPVDPDQVRDGRRVHDVMVTGGQVTAPHRDRVTGWG
jgi:hypothetical protein